MESCHFFHWSFCLEQSPFPWATRSNSIQFSLVQDGIYALGKAHPVSQKFPQCCLWNGSNVHLIDDGPLWSFQGRSSSAALCLQVVSQASQNFREASHLWGSLCPPVYLLSHFPSLRQTLSAFQSQWLNFSQTPSPTPNVFTGLQPASCKLVCVM